MDSPVDGYEVEGNVGGLRFCLQGKVAGLEDETEDWLWIWTLVGKVDESDEEVGNEVVLVSVGTGGTFIIRQERVDKETGKEVVEIVGGGGIMEVDGDETDKRGDRGVLLPVTWDW